jgi:hypothetical protein
MKQYWTVLENLTDPVYFTSNIYYLIKVRVSRGGETGNQIRSAFKYELKHKVCTDIIIYSGTVVAR